jgi:hypothetical protein
MTRDDSRIINRLWVMDNDSYIMTPRLWLIDYVYKNILK